MKVYIVVDDEYFDNMQIFSNKDEAENLGIENGMEVKIC